MAFSIRWLTLIFAGLNKTTTGLPFKLTQYLEQQNGLDALLPELTAIRKIHGHPTVFIDAIGSLFLGHLRLPFQLVNKGKSPLQIFDAGF